MKIPLRVAAWLCVSCSLFLFTGEALAGEEQSASDERQVQPLSEAGATSMTQSIQGESGISVQTMCTNCNSADLSVGSFGNDFISMVCDGLPVPPGLAQIYLLSVVPPSVIDNVSVEKGAGRARVDGGLIGGEIDVRRRQPAEGIQANLTVDAGEYDWGGARADVSGRYGWFGGSLIASWAQSAMVDADMDDNPEMAAIDRMTYEGRFDFWPGDMHHISLGASDYDESQLDGRAGYNSYLSDVDSVVWNRENVDLERRQYDLTYKADFRDGSNLAVGLLRADRETVIDEEGDFSERGDFFLAYQIWEEQRHANLSWFRPLGNRVVLRAGASWTEQQYGILDETFNATHSFQGIPEDYIGRETLTEDGYWAEGEFSLGSRVNLFAGLRRVNYEYEDDTEVLAGMISVWNRWLDYDLPEGTKLLPRAALSWKPVNKVSVRLSAGRGMRQPSPVFEEVCCGRRYRNNRGIHLEESRIFGLEATIQPSPRYQLNASLFHTDFNNLIIKMVGATVGGSFGAYSPIYQNVNVPKARFDSLSLEGRFDPARWINIRAGASWTDADNRTEDDAIPALTADYADRPVLIMHYLADIPYVPDRTGSLSLQFRPPRGGLTIDVSAQYTGPQYIQQWGEDQPTDFIATPDFWIYNLRASRTFRDAFDLFVGVDNIGDYLQEDLRNPGTDYTWGPLRGRYYYAGWTYRFARWGS